jgi:hypothetical protein
MKRLMILLLTVCICGGLCIQAYALAPDVSPLWNNIIKLSNRIVFDGTNGSAYGSVSGKSGTSSISGTLTVYRQSGSSWIYVDSTSGTSSNTILSLGCDFTAVSGGYYKSVFEVTVTINGLEESATKTSYGTCT